MYRKPCNSENSYTNPKWRVWIKMVVDRREMNNNGSSSLLEKCDIRCQLPTNKQNHLV